MHQLLHYSIIALKFIFTLVLIFAMCMFCYHLVAHHDQIEALHTMTAGDLLIAIALCFLSGMIGRINDSLMEIANRMIPKRTKKTQS